MSDDEDDIGNIKLSDLRRRRVEVGEGTGPGSIAGDGEVVADIIAGRDAVCDSGAQVVVNIGDVLSEVRRLRDEHGGDTDAGLDLLSDQIVALADGLMEIVKEGEVARITICQLEAMVGRLVSSIYGNDGKGLKVIVFQNKEAIRLHVENRDRRLNEMDIWITRRLGSQSMAIMLLGIIDVVLIVIVLLLLRQAGI